jgi:hypothetical protein
MFAGIGTVFVALIAIIAIIQFSISFGKRPDLKSKNRSGTGFPAKLAKPLPPGGRDEIDGPAQAGGELVAVYRGLDRRRSGLSPSSFRIASVRSRRRREWRRRI